MIDSQFPEFDAIVEQWSAAMKREEFNNALEYAAQSLALSIEFKEPALQKAASLYVEAAVNGILKEREPKLGLVRCSFCMRTRDEARLMLGADGNICEHCASKVFHFFEEDEGT